MTIADLWSIIDGSVNARRLTYEKLKEIIQTDQCRVAIDAPLLAMSRYSAIWSGQAKRGRFDVQAATDATIESLRVINSNFQRNGIDVLWCFDGSKTIHKLATQGRLDIRDAKYLKAVNAYRKCQAIADALRIPQLQIQVDQMKFLEAKFYVLKDNTHPVYLEQAPTTILFDSCMQEIKKELQWTSVLPNSFGDVILNALTKSGLQCLKVPTISEAEKLATILIQQNFCQAVYSCDGDLIPLGARWIIKSIEKDSLEVYMYEDIEKALGLGREKLVHMCIMLGTDFNKRIRGLGPVKIRERMNLSNFSIYDLSKQNCGRLKVNVCIQMFTISKEDHEEVIEEIMKTFA
jgi:hypothetical protein